MIWIREEEEKMRRVRGEEDLGKGRRGKGKRKEMFYREINLYYERKHLSELTVCYQFRTCHHVSKVTTIITLL